MLAQEKMISHSGDVIANDSMARLVLRLLGVGFRHGFRMIEIKLKQLSQGFHGPLAVDHDGGLVIKLFEQKVLERGVLLGHLRTESRQAPALVPHLFDALPASIYPHPAPLPTQA